MLVTRTKALHKGNKEETLQNLTAKGNIAIRNEREGAYEKRQVALRN